jgi:4-amino-4-deoxy-L-arabinose transferase-like glycosyltransferase
MTKESSSRMPRPVQRPLQNLAAWIEQRPGRAFAAFAVLHAAIWTALPALLYPNLPLDLIEALTYGQEWQLGYDKLPPLPWWLVEIAYRAVGRDFAYYALAQIAVLSAFWLVFITARRIVGPLGALAAVLIVDGVHYFNYTAAKFNHDVIQLPFWALAGYAFHAGLRRGRIFDWILLGIAVGFALWAKYFVVVLAAPLALFVLIDDDARKSLRTPGPWIAILVALLVMAPHILWLVANDFLPFRYAEARAAVARGVIDHFVHPGSFAGSQISFLIPALVVALPLFWPRAPKTANAPQDFDNRIVTLLAFGPFVTVLLLSIATGRGTIAMWGYPLFLFLGLWFVMVARQTIAGERLARTVALWGAVTFIYVAVFIVNYDVLPRFDHRYRAVHYPGDALATELSKRFRAATGHSLAYVIGPMWDGGNVGHYAPEHPRVLIDGRPERAPWIDLGDLFSKGAVVLWTDSDPLVIPVALRNIAADAQVQEPFTIPYRRGDHEVSVGWAILRPQPVHADSLSIVMAGLVPAIHALAEKSKTWMPATSAGMTVVGFSPPP